MCEGEKFAPQEDGLSVLDNFCRVLLLLLSVGLFIFLALSSLSLLSLSE